MPQNTFEIWNEFRVAAKVQLPYQAFLKKIRMVTLPNVASSTNWSMTTRTMSCFWSHVVHPRFLFRPVFCTSNLSVWTSHDILVHFYMCLLFSNTSILQQITTSDALCRGSTLIFSSEYFQILEWEMYAFPRIGRAFLSRSLEAGGIAGRYSKSGISISFEYLTNTESVVHPHLVT